MLIKKIFRDLKQQWLQFLAVFLMSFICLFIFSGISNVSNRMNTTMETFVADSNLADITVTGQQFTQEELDAAAALAPVTALDTRRITKAEETDYTVTLLSFNEQAISCPILISGQELSEMSGVWLDDDFFQANHLEIGETIQLMNQKYEILGTIKQPEFVYFSAAKDQILPNHVTNGYAYIHASFFPDVPAKEELLLQLTDTSNQTWLETQLYNLPNHAVQEVTLQENYTAVKFINERIFQIQRLAVLFSALFALLTVITMEATMRRFIQQQQLVIGTYKSMGISNRSIVGQYLVYSLLTTAVGSLLGYFFGPVLLSPVLLNTIAEQFSVPKWLAADSGQPVWPVILLILLSMLVTLLPLHEILKRQPAAIFQREEDSRQAHKTQEESKLWTKLPFTLQWTIRDIQRNIRRAMIGIFGAMGCMMLLITAFGLRDSINFSIDETFQQTYTYEERLTFSQQPADYQQLTLDTQQQWLQQQDIQLLTATGVEDSTATIVSEGSMVQLYDASGEQIMIAELRENEVVLSAALADNLNISAGDTLYLKKQQQLYPVHVKQLSILSSPQGLLTNQFVWKQIGFDFQPDVLLLPKANIQSSEEQMTFTRVAKTQQITEANQMLTTIWSIVLLLILAAVVLGITIMANCHLLIFSERFIEFATLKVLGFTQREVLSLSFLETLLLTIIGGAAGLPLGWQFLKMYIAAVSTSNQEYLPAITWQSLLIAVCILIICMCAVQLFINRMIKRIDFATALKPTE